MVLGAAGLAWWLLRLVWVPGPAVATAESVALGPAPASCVVGPQVVDDVSRLNPVQVAVVCRPATEAQIVAAVAYGRAAGLRVSIAGARHSQGGHTSSPGGLVLELEEHRGVSLDGDVATVRSGTTWAQVQEVANRAGLAVRVQQSSNIFTVGGSLSVNCHGRDKDFGPIASTVRSLRVLLADGRIVTATPDATPEGTPDSEAGALFAAVLGGYGLVGVILDAELQLRPNVEVRKTVVIHDVGAYVARLDAVVADPTIQLHYGRLNLDERDAEGFLREMYSVEYRSTGRVLAGTPLRQEESASLNGLGMELGEWSSLAKAARWKTIQSRIDVPGSTELMSLNDAMRPPVAFLFARWGTTTVNILQEYFVPPSGFEAFVDQLRTQTHAHGVDLQNITTRWVAGGDRALLTYAPEPRIAVVLYVNLPLTERGIATGQAWTRALVDASLAQGGSYYLAYQRWPTREQVLRAYPAWAAFGEARARFDPDGLFHSQFWAAYGH